MFLYALAFMLGNITLYFFKFLPSNYWWCILFSIALYKFKNNYLNIIKKFFIIFLLGFFWCFFYASHIKAWNIPSDWEGKAVTVIGFVKTIPDIEQHHTSFLLLPTQINFNEKSLLIPKFLQPLLKLSWQNCPTIIRVGDELKLRVKLKKIHGTLNPHTFDYEAWAFQENIRGQGYVISKSKNEILAHHFFKFPVESIRQIILEKLTRNLSSTKNLPWIIALILGERRHIPKENWDILRKTGTNHLMAIAGLHIGFMASFFYLLFKYAWKLFPRVMLFWPAQYAGACGSLFIAIVYSCLAGFSIPTQRACLMISIFLSAILFKKNIIAWHVLGLTIVILLTLNPLNTLSSSFWLSFGSVAFIIYGMTHRLNPDNLWWKHGRIQFVIALGIIPFGIYFFNEFSWIGFIANSITIPIVGFIILPLCFLGCTTLLVYEKVGRLILELSDNILTLLWKILTWFSELKYSSSFFYFEENSIVLSALVGFILIVMPRGFPGRLFGLIWLLPMFFYQTAVPNKGDVWFTLLDVGQGLSAVIQTEKHNLIFDTGAKYNENFDMGESVIIPFIRSLNYKNVNMLVVSHQDNDHSGGAPAIIKQLKVSNIKTSVPELFPNNHAEYCLAGESWVWDEVKFEFLYPTLNNLDLDNNSSCVLKITSHNQSILLTGDIEKFAERFMVEKQLPLKSSVLVAPHHGSKTSGNIDFLKAVSPQYVLFPIGYRNRYHFPHSSVIQKYKQLGTTMLDSVMCGAIKFKILNGEIKDPNCYRKETGKYWNVDV